MRFWPDLEPKLTVIPHGIGDDYLAIERQRLPKELQAMGVSPRFILYVGGSIPRKRLTWALKVFSALADAQIQLVVLGVENADVPRIMQSVRPDVRGQLVFPPFLAESVLPALYQNAIAVLYPTQYEGFGLPVLEAQAAGTPILFSDVGNLGELKGPAAQLLPTDDLESWVGTCRRLIEERGHYPQPVEAAQHWARRFSWETSARKHLEVYEKVVGAQKKLPAPGRHAAN